MYVCMYIYIQWIPPTGAVSRSEGGMPPPTVAVSPRAETKLADPPPGPCPRAERHVPSYLPYRRGAPRRTSYRRRALRRIRPYWRHNPYRRGAPRRTPYRRGALRRWPYPLPSRLR